MGKSVQDGGFAGKLHATFEGIVSNRYPISEQNILGVASGRNLLNMTPQPSGSGNAICVTDLFGKHPLTIDFLYVKDASHSLGP